MKIIIFLFPIILILVFLFIKLWSNDTYRLLVEEDSWIEYAQYLFFFISSAFSFLIAMKFLKNRRIIHGVLYGILAVGLLFVSMEEISWGQRIFNLANPDYFEQHNWQHEMSLHNLDVIRPTVLNKIYILTGFFGAFAWLFLRPFMSSGKVGRDHIVNYIVPAWHISAYFFFVFFIYTLLDCLKPQTGSFLVWKDQEVAELTLSLGFLLFTVANYMQVNTSFKMEKTVQPLGESRLDLDLKTDTLHQHETDADSLSWPVTLRKIGSAYRFYIIGAIIVIIISGILLVASGKITAKRSGEQTADRESLEVITPVTGENVSPGDLLNQALAHCSGERCTNPKKAIEFLNEAIKMQPDFIDAYAIRGNVYVQRGMYEHAIRDYNEVMRLNPDDVRVYANRGTAYLMNKDITRGCEDIQKACESGNCHALQWAQSKGFCR